MNMSEIEKIVIEDKIEKGVFSKILATMVLILSLFSAINGAIIGFFVSQQYETQKAYNKMTTQLEIKNINSAKILAKKSNETGEYNYARGSM